MNKAELKTQLRLQRQSFDDDVQAKLAYLGSDNVFKNNESPKRDFSQAFVSEMVNIETKKENKIVNKDNAQSLAEKITVMRGLARPGMYIKNDL